MICRVRRIRSNPDANIIVIKQLNAVVIFVIDRISCAKGRLNNRLHRHRREEDVLTHSYQINNTVKIEGFTAKPVDFAGFAGNGSAVLPENIFNVFPLNGAFVKGPKCRKPHFYSCVLGFCGLNHRDKNY